MIKKVTLYNFKKKYYYSIIAFLFFSFFCFSSDTIFTEKFKVIDLIKTSKIQILKDNKDFTNQESNDLFPFTPENENEVTISGVFYVQCREAIYSKNLSNANIIIINRSNIDSISYNKTQNYTNKSLKYKKNNILTKPTVFNASIFTSNAPFSNNLLSLFKNNTYFSLPSIQTYKFVNVYCNFIENKFKFSLKIFKKKIIYSYKSFKLYTRISKYYNKPPPC